MSVLDCIGKLVKGGVIDAEQAAKAKEIYEAAKNGIELEVGPGASAAIAALKTAEAMAKTAEETKYRVAMNAKAIYEASKRLDEDPHSKAAGLARTLASVEATGGQAGGKNVQSLTEAIEGWIAKPFSDAMEKYSSKFAGLKKDLEGPRNVVRELFGIDTGDSFAKSAAEGWQGAHDRAIARAKIAGKAFAPNEDWRLPQFWSTARTREFGKGEFVTDIMDAINSGALQVLDADAGHLPATGSRIQEIVDRSAGKIWLGTGESTGYGAPVSFSAETRIFKFAEGQKGADAWLNLQGKYGVGQDVMQSLTSHVHHQAREIALMDTFGPNHRANFQALMEKVREEKAEQGLKGPGVVDRIKAMTLSDVSPAAIAGKLADAQLKMFTSEAGLMRMYKTATGEADAVSGQFWGGVFGSLRHVSVVSQMGSAIVSSIAPDSAAAMLAAKHMGIPPVQMLARITKEFASSGEEGRKMLAQMGIVAHSSIDLALNASRYADEGKIADTLSKVSNTVIRVQGLHHWDETLKRAFTMEAMGLMARESANPFAKVSPEFKAWLDRHKFTESEWDVLRAGNHIEIDGARFFDPDSIGDLALAERFKSGIIDERRYAAPEAGIIEKSFSADMKRGTFMGELGRSMFMYKSFPMWMMLTHVQRGAVEMAEGKGGYMAQLFVGLAIAGMATIQVKDMLQGKDPRPMNRVDTWLAAIAQGGGGGIYGDFLKSGVDRSGHGITDAIVGPVGGLVTDIAKLTSQNARQMYEGSPTHWQGEGVNFLRRYTPGSNLWFSRLAADRLVFDQVQKAVDPEYAQSFRRIRDKMQKENGQKFYWDKGETAPARAPDLSKMLGG